MLAPSLEHNNDAQGSDTGQIPSGGPASGVSQAITNNTASHGANQIINNTGIINIKQTANLHEKPPDEIFDAPGLLSAHFTRRTAELRIIQDVFDTPASKTPSRCIVWGMPGLGKTQLALKYADSAYNELFFKYVFWISGSSVEKINQGFTKLLELVRHPNRASMDQEAKLLNTRLWLEESTTKWLLVVDNAQPETVAGLREILPKRSSNGCILITTRTKTTAMALTESGHRVIELKQPSSEDAIEQFLKTTQSNSSVPDLRKSAEGIVKSGAMPQTLLEIYKSEQVEKVFDWENSLSLHEERSVTATFALAFEQLVQTSFVTSNLLRILSFLDPESIAVDMLVQGCTALQKPFARPATVQALKKHSNLVKKKLKARRGSASEAPPEPIVTAAEIPVNASQDISVLLQSRVELQQAIQLLQRLSLIVSKSEGGRQTLWLHDLVHLLLRTKFTSASDRSVWLEQAILITGDAFDLIGDRRAPENWSKCESFVAHFRCLSEHAKTLGFDSIRLLDSNMWIAIYFHASGRYDEEEVLEKQVAQERKRILGPEHPQTLYSMINLATTYSRMGRMDVAEKLEVEVLQACKRVLGVEHPNTLIIMANLAATYFRMGRTDEAEKLEVEVLQTRKRVLGVEHPDTLHSMANLAATFSRMGRTDEAEKLEVEVLQSRKRVLGVEHPQTLRSTANLATMYSSTGRSTEAEVLELRVLETRKSFFGVDHPDTLHSMNNLAHTWRALGRKEDALKLMTDAHTRLEGKLGANHPYTLSAKRTLAVWQQEE